PLKIPLDVHLRQIEGAEITLAAALFVWKLFLTADNKVDKLSKGLSIFRFRQCSQFCLCPGNVIVHDGTSVIHAAFFVYKGYNLINISLFFVAFAHQVSNVNSFHDGSILECLDERERDFSLTDIIALGLANIAHFVVKKIISDLEGDAGMQANIVHFLLVPRVCRSRDSTAFATGSNKAGGFLRNHFEIIFLILIKKTGRFKL